jgi:hypothetical protein
MKLIESKTLGTAQASIEFTNIPQTFTDLVILGSTRMSNAALLGYNTIRFNNDTASNYSYRFLDANLPSSPASGSSTTNPWFANVSGSSTTSNTFGNYAVYIPNYTSTVAKSGSIDTVGENNGTTAFLTILACLYNNSTAITSIQINDAFNSSNFVAGSTISLYGILKGSDGIVTTSP